MCSFAFSIIYHVSVGKSPGRYVYDKYDSIPRLPYSLMRALHILHGGVAWMQYALQVTSITSWHCMAI